MTDVGVRENVRAADMTNVTLLTGGGDRPYAFGMAQALTGAGLSLDFIGSDDLEMPELLSNPLIRFLNLRGDQRPEAPPLTKVRRVAAYYARLIRYAARAKPPIFHILWNNKIELIDRTILQLFYRLKRRRVVLTVHNVNREARDGTDSWINRLTLKCQYRLCDHLFVHTEDMRRELENGFGVPAAKISVIPFPINNSVPNTDLTGPEARRRLGIAESAKVVLLFGNIAPYKGAEYLVDALARVVTTHPDCVLVIVGRPKGPKSYWADIEQRIMALGLDAHVIRRIEYVPDEDTEVYFKAADVLALPYVVVFQSGVLFLAFNFGLPVIATDVASFKQDVIEGITGFVCAPKDETALASAIERFFASDLYRNRECAREEIRRIGHEQHSWAKVTEITTGVYASLSSNGGRPRPHPA
jgi:glycosyltransferase involved in cell wall biosynthesis